MTLDQHHALGRLQDELARLEALRANISQDLLDEEYGVERELSLLDQHPSEIGSEVHDLERDQAIAESVESELAEVRAAIGRVEDGTYGRCEVDGEPIPPERLEAMPATRRCAAHQVEADRA
ncbi:MAG: TraR/DksA C4-type zinc finger protein [Actinomycetota bacterium]|nr:TraR/DksA C4-type zinc finger protein [Actinomycetota bacterium]